MCRYINLCTKNSILIDIQLFQLPTRCHQKTFQDCPPDVTRNLATQMFLQNPEGDAPPPWRCGKKATLKKTSYGKQLVLERIHKHGTHWFHKREKRITGDRFEGVEKILTHSETCGQSICFTICFKKATRPTNDCFECDDAVNHNAELTNRLYKHKCPYTLPFILML